MSTDPEAHHGTEPLSRADVLIGDFLALQRSMREGLISFPAYLDAWEALLEQARQVAATIPSARTPSYGEDAAPGAAW